MADDKACTDDKDSEAHDARPDLTVEEMAAENANTAIMMATDHERRLVKLMARVAQLEADRRAAVGPSYIGEGDVWHIGTLKIGETDKDPGAEWVGEMLQYARDAKRYDPDRSAFGLSGKRRADAPSDERPAYGQTGPAELARALTRINELEEHASEREWTIHRVASQRDALTTKCNAAQERIQQLEIAVGTSQANYEALVQGNAMAAARAARNPAGLADALNADWLDANAAPQAMAELGGKLARALEWPDGQTFTIDQLLEAVATRSKSWASQAAALARAQQERGVTQKALDNFMSACADQTIQIMELRGQINSLKVIADVPDGDRVPRAELEVAYNRVKELEGQIDRAEPVFEALVTWKREFVGGPISYEKELVTAYSEWELAERKAVDDQDRNSEDR